MSILCEVTFEPLQCDGSNYYSWSAHVLNALRALGPSNEQVVDTSILPKDFDNLAKLSNKEKEYWFRNLCVTNLLFENMDKELSDLIHKEDKLQVTCVDAHRLWKFLEAICEEDSDDEDREEEEESLEECSTSETCIHPIETPHEDQGEESTKSAGS